MEFADNVKLLFVGERRSNLAKKMGVIWINGRLGAKQLFDALNANNINPHLCKFCNWFEGGKKITREHTGIVIAMGRKVEAALIKEGIKHIFIYHPATRGTIRKKANYIQHVKEQFHSITNLTK